MTIDGALLPIGFQSYKKEGRYVEFYSDGSLAYVGFYVNGEPQGWTLSLNPNQHTGRAEKVERSRVTYPDYEETLGADTSLAEAERLYREWVEIWIKEIEKAASDFEAAIPVRRCDFCQKRSDQVRKMIAGSTSCICNECVELCNQLIEAESICNPIA